MKGAIIALACFGLMLTGTSIDAESFLGFELLDLDGAQVKWGGGNEGRPPLVTYALVTGESKFAGARNCPAMVPVGGLLAKSRILAADFDAELRAAIELWERAANIEFRQVADPVAADILIGAQERPVGRAFTNIVYKPGAGPVRLIERSLICLNPEQAWKIGFDGNLDAYDLRYTIAHEIGHAIGLDHPSPSGQVMSFLYDELFRQLQPGDLSGAARIYGPRVSN